MARDLSVAIACQDEAQTLPYTLYCIHKVLEPYLADVVLIDGGSKDNTIEVIEAWREVLPIVLLHHPFDTPGKQKNRALHRCSGKWILAIDADHTFGINMGNVYASGYFDAHPIWDFMVYVCAVDEYHSYNKHTSAGGPLGPTTRMFLSTYRYQHDYHEQIWMDKRPNIGACKVVPFFEHCLLQTKSALQQRGIRWQPHAAGMMARGHGPGGPARYLEAERVTGAGCVPLPSKIRDLVLPRNIPVLRKLDEYRAQGHEEPPPTEFWEEGYGL